MPRAVGWTTAVMLLASVAEAPAQARIWDEDDRIHISSFNDVAAVAFDGRRVFAATLNGLEIYDVIARRWLAPSTVEDGYPVFDRPLAIAYDRSQGGLWLRTANGLFLWSDLSGRWDMRSPFDMPESLRSPSAAPDRDIAWRALRGSVTLDPQSRRWPLTAVAPADREGTYWVATAGNNILFADTRNLSSQWLSFGTLSRGTSALAIGSGGSIWFGGDGFGPRYGITQADSSLENWVYFEPVPNRAPRREVRRILVTGESVWFAASDGVYVKQPDSRVWPRLGEAQNLPSDNARALARSSHGIWAGTTHGVALIDVETLRVKWKGMPGVRINGLIERNDTLWIGSDAGLWIATPSESGFNVVAAPGSDAQPALRRSITGVARVGSTIAVLAVDAIYLFDREWTVLAQRGAAMLGGGQPQGLRGDERRLYVLGSRGLAQWSADTKEWRQLAVPADIPAGPVRDVIRSGEFIWVATPAGATRLQWP